MHPKMANMRMLEMVVETMISLVFLVSSSKAMLCYNSNPKERSTEINFNLLNIMGRTDQYLVQNKQHEETNPHHHMETAEHQQVLKSKPYS